jgi:hypothetical protein
MADTARQARKSGGMKWGGTMQNENQLVAIPTIWRGITYKSRLEAKFARWLVEGLAATKAEVCYEPRRLGSNRYLPDFLVVTPDEKVFIEIKPFNLASDTWMAIDAAVETGISLMVIDSFGRNVWGCFGSVEVGEVDYFTTHIAHVLSVMIDLRRARPLYWFGTHVSART